MNFMFILMLYYTGLSPGQLLLNLLEQTDLENITDELKSEVLSEPEYPVTEQTDTDTPEPSSDIIELEEEIHEWTNNYRMENDLEAVDFNMRLANVARAHSQDMATRDYFSHTNLEDENPTDRAERANFHCNINLGNGYYVKGVSENIWQGWTYSHTLAGKPMGFFTDTELAHKIVDDWMNSPGHRKNILTEFWKSEGIGVTITENGKVYATQNFC